MSQAVASQGGSRRRRRLRRTIRQWGRWLRDRGRLAFSEGPEPCTARGKCNGQRRSDRQQPDPCRDGPETLPLDPLSFHVFSLQRPPGPAGPRFYERPPREIVSARARLRSLSQRAKISTAAGCLQATLASASPPDATRPGWRDIPASLARATRRPSSAASGTRVVLELRLAEPTRQDDLVDEIAHLTRRAGPAADRKSRFLLWALDVDSRHGTRSPRRATCRTTENGARVAQLAVNDHGERKS
jgi:hypothetical protein